MVTRVTLREISYIALEKTFSGTLPQWLFPAGLPAGDREEQAALTRQTTKAYSLRSSNDRATPNAQTNAP